MRSVNENLGPSTLSEPCFSATALSPFQGEILDANLGRKVDAARRRLDARGMKSLIASLSEESVLKNVITRARSDGTSESGLSSHFAVMETINLIG